MWELAKFYLYLAFARLSSLFPPEGIDQVFHIVL
jgi:hypothetical protein